MDEPERIIARSEIFAGFLSGGIFLSAMIGWLTWSPGMLALLALSAVVAIDEMVPRGRQPYMASILVGFGIGAAASVTSYVAGYFSYFLAITVFLVIAKYSYKYMKRMKQHRGENPEEPPEPRDDSRSREEERPAGPGGGQEHPPESRPEHPPEGSRDHYS